VELIDFLKKVLTVVKYSKHEITNSLKELATTQPELAAQVNYFEQWLVGEVEG
jgi:hypothetical protein